MELEGVGGAGDDGGVEAEEQAAEGSGEGAFDEEVDGVFLGVHVGLRVQRQQGSRFGWIVWLKNFKQC